MKLKNNKLINRYIWKNSLIADDDRYLFDMNLKKKSYRKIKLKKKKKLNACYISMSFQNSSAALESFAGANRFLRQMPAECHVISPQEWDDIYC